MARATIGHVAKCHMSCGIFHSGNKMTADDVVWTFNRLKSSGDFKAVFAPYEKLVKIDDYTVEIISFEPYPLVLQTATYIFPMDSKFYSGEVDGKDKSIIVKHGNSFASTNVSGTGPFTVTSREQGVKVVFDRFDNYWDTKSPGNVDKLTLMSNELLLHQNTLNLREEFFVMHENKKIYFLNIV